MIVRWRLRSFEFRRNGSYALFPAVLCILTVRCDRLLRCPNVSRRCLDSHVRTTQPSISQLKPPARLWCPRKQLLGFFRLSLRSNRSVGLDHLRWLDLVPARTAGRAGMVCRPARRAASSAPLEPTSSPQARALVRRKQLRFVVFPTRFHSPSLQGLIDPFRSNIR